MDAAQTIEILGKRMTPLRIQRLKLVANSQLGLTDRSRGKVARWPEKVLEAPSLRVFLDYGLVQYVPRPGLGGKGLLYVITPLGGEVLSLLRGA